MEFTGRYLIPASPEAVWAALNDTEILKASIPGCEQMEKVDETHFNVATTLKIGPVKAKFRGRIELSEMDLPRRCVLKGEGRGGVAGSARGEAEVLLVPDDRCTALSYTAKAMMSGRLAKIGQRLIDRAAKQIADNFFSRFAAILTAAPAGPEAAVLDAMAPELAPAVAAPPLVATSPPDGDVEVRRDGLAPEIWVVGLIAVIVILLILFGMVL